MHISYLLTALTATLAIAAPTAAPNTSVEGEPTCFRIQGHGDKKIHGKWLEDEKHGDLEFEDYKKSGLYVLDSNKGLRNAYTGSLATRDPIGKLEYGPVEMNKPGHKLKGDKVTCYIENKVLKCYTKIGDRTYSKGDNFYIGQNGPSHMYPASLYVKEEACPKGVWTTWV